MVTRPFPLDAAARRQGLGAEAGGDAASVLDGGVKIGVGLELLGCGPAGLGETRGRGPLADERGRGTRHVRHVAGAEEDELRATTDPRGVEPEDGAGADEGEVAVATRHLGDGLARALHREGRDLDLHEQLVRFERGGEETAEEVGRAAGARGPRASQMENRVEGEHARGQLGGGIGVGQAPADGSARPRLEVPDERRRLGQQRSGGGDTRVALEGALAHERAQPQTPCSARTAASAATRLRSTRTAGRARRMFIMGTRLWPPASGLASGPWRARSSSASSTARGAKYSNGAGRTRPRSARAWGARTWAASRPTESSAPGSS